MNGIGGDGFTFSCYEKSDFVTLQWVKKHLANDMYLGGNNYNEGNFYNFSLGKHLYVYDREVYKIDTIEVFKVVKK